MSILLPPEFFDQLLPNNQSSRDACQSFVRGLPHLEEKDIAPDDTCAICQETFLAIIAAQEIASVMETLAQEDMGVIQLPGCGHRFCRKDIATWVYSSHSTCPACRHQIFHMPEPTREPAQSGETEPGSINQVREWIRELQQRFSVTNENPGEAYPDLFNVENGSISDDAPERIFQRLQGHFLFSPPSRQDDRREYSGMYS